jgi:hypothetical protein
MKNISSFDRVCYVPGMSKNLLSLRQLFKEGFKIAIWDVNQAALIKDTTVLKFKVVRGLYALRPHEAAVNTCIYRKPTPKLVQWHHRLAHLNFDANKIAARDGVVDGLHLTKSELNQEYNCEICEVSKAKRMTYKHTHPNRATVPLEHIHIDKGGPMTPPTFSAKAHDELFVDEASRFK